MCRVTGQPVLPSTASLKRNFLLDLLHYCLFFLCLESAEVDLNRIPESKSLGVSKIKAKQFK